PTVSWANLALTWLHPPKPCIRPSPKRKFGGSPGNGSSRTEAQRVPMKGLGGGSLPAVAQPARTNATKDRRSRFMGAPFDSIRHEEIDRRSDQVDAEDADVL